MRGVPIRAVRDPSAYRVTEVLQHPWSEVVTRTMESFTFWSSLPLMDGALEGVRWLEAKLAQILVLTSPYDSCPGWYDARVAWLTKNFGFTRDQIMVGSAKEWVTGADVFIDDRPKHIAGWATRHPSGLALLYDAPYNRDCTGFTRVTWKTIPRVINGILA